MTVAETIALCSAGIGLLTFAFNFAKFWAGDSLAKARRIFLVFGAVCLLGGVGGLVYFLVAREAPLPEKIVLVHYPGWLNPYGQNRDDAVLDVAAPKYDEQGTYVEEFSKLIDVFVPSSGAYGKLIEAGPASFGDNFDCFIPKREVKELGAEYQPLLLIAKTCTWAKDISAVAAEKRTEVLRKHLVSLKPAPYATFLGQLLFVDLQSASGFIAPVRALGLEGKLGDVRCAGSHKAALEFLLTSNKCVMVASNDDAIGRLIADGGAKVRDKAIEVPIGKRLPRSPVCVNKRWTEPKGLLKRLVGISEVEPIENDGYADFYKTQMKPVLEASKKARCSLLAPN